ncbi:methyltransferase family protein [Cellulomonas marina]|uniref:Protein-S-isoprenylcysteine O-methyltransferase Ste14 n=1 Tax=Cellulomonas marina TaxID=988821 RepID=A0A1I1AUL1_9CELL|nr:methyltransferase [Cellulomonas marina]GIG30735.1 hypothetical protein Cma02nite_33350 [Cellulomonas marina]SFB41769.1 Protein-S-isoprenylcysteine O-methyltransferase Ste14 [Cellulomonas marina]
MNARGAAAVALTVYLMAVVVMFGIRSWAHRRHTGSTGFRGVSGPAGSSGWWGGRLFALALLLGAAGPALALARALLPPANLPGALAWVGLLVAVAAFVVVAAAQSGMGASWRIGVDATERTDLVTTGLFAVARNPIFTAMAIALAGIVLMVPTAVTLAALVALVLAVQLQVRAVEEPYLLTTHGAAYAAYAARVGRFVPGIGRLRSADTAVR